MRRLPWVGLIAIAFLSACGSTPSRPEDSAPNDEAPTSEPGDTASETCVAKSCAELGAQCGSVADGCGATLSCGSCANDEHCGGGGAPNVCGKAACAPKTCAELIRSCGLVSDGCGAALNCGGCQSGESCSEAGSCAASTCVPKTCAALARSCGQASDGCGGTLECGGCPSGATCDSAGHCGTAAQPGDVEWIQVEPGSLRAIDADQQGNLYYLTPTAGNDTTISSRSPTGAKRWSVVSEHSLHVMAANPTADALFVHGFRASPPECDISCAMQVTVKYSKTGANPAVVGGGTAEGGSMIYAISPGGSQIWWRASVSSEKVEVRHPDGTGFDIDQYLQPQVSIRAGAFDLAGNVVLVGSTVGGWTYKGQLFGDPAGSGDRHPLVLKLTRTGEIIWAKSMSAMGALLEVQTTAAGTVVALLEAQATFTFANQPHGASSGPTIHLTVWEPDGRERVAMGNLPAFTVMGIARHLAVVPMGRAYLAETGSNGKLNVLKFNLVGALEWKRSFIAANALDPNSGFRGIEVVEGGAVVAGTFSGTATFGSQMRTSTAESVFLVKLRP